MHRQSCTNC